MMTIPAHDRAASAHAASEPKPMVNHLQALCRAVRTDAEPVLVGRGSTALWLALRAVARKYGAGEVIVPDLLCLSALEAVLLAGFIPVFASVLPRRYGLDPASVARCRTTQTRAVLVAHLFGHIAEMESIREAAPRAVIIEDAVQGFGGTFSSQAAPVGTLADLSFISFDDTKMIGGRGGVLWSTDADLWTGIAADTARLSTGEVLSELDFGAPSRLLPDVAAHAYRQQLANAAPGLLRPFDHSTANVRRIVDDWQTLPERVPARNARAMQLANGLSSLLPDRIILPEIRPGDAIWRYTVALDTPARARWISHQLQLANLAGSNLYPSLNHLFTTPQGDAGSAPQLAGRLINLWVDEHTPRQTIEGVVSVFQRALAADLSFRSFT